MMHQHTIYTPYMVGEVHCYSTEINGELVLFDTGPALPAALASLQKSVDLERLRYVFITHGHVDHYGLAAHIHAHFGAEILIPRKDAIKLQRQAERLAHMDNLILECGFDESFIRRLRKTFTDNKIFPIIPDRYHIVEESDIPERLGIRWISCPGHSQSDLVYLYGNYAVTGDILLKNIFQAPLLDVDLETFSGRFRNYDAYCSSLLKMKALSGLRILPGHRNEVMGLDSTVIFYIRKLLERAGLVGRISANESVCGVIGKLFGGAMTDPFLLYLKASEIVFMRDFLADPNKLRSTLEQIGMFDQVSALYRGVVEKQE